MTKLLGNAHREAYDISVDNGVFGYSKCLDKKKKRGKKKKTRER